MKRRAVFSWCLYDWANSAYPTVISTFIFATYFTRAVAPDEVTGTAIWGNTLAVGGLLVAVLAPVLGAIADHAGARKPWLFVMTAICALGAAGLWYATPDPSAIPLTVILIILGISGFEFGMMFYNAMLAGIAPQGWLGRISGWGWALGYAGGLASLAFCLVGFVQTETPLFGLGTENSENIRAVGPFVALWVLLFSLPLFLFVPDSGKKAMPIRAAVSTGVSALLTTLRRLPEQRTILRFLIARMLYNDGLATLFAFGGIYAAGTFGMSFAQVIQFAIALNVGAGLGAAAFAFADDRFGSKPVIVISLIAIIFCGTGLLLVSSITWFWVLGLALSIFLGPVQAASRSMMARLSPPDLQTEYFGLYALSGKATSFLGPLVLGWATLWFDSQRAGMATIILFLLAGLALLWGLQASKDAGDGKNAEPISR